MSANPAIENHGELVSLDPLVKALFYSVAKVVGARGIALDAQHELKVSVGWTRCLNSGLDMRGLATSTHE